MKALIRNKLRKYYLDLFGSILKASPGIHLLNSHILTMDESLNSEHFDYQLGKLSKFSTIIPFEEAVSLIHTRAKIKRPLVAFSYDDGLAECHSHIAPVLEAYNGYGCFFINPNFINANEDYRIKFLRDKIHLPEYKMPMSWEQVIDLEKKGHIIGAHTMDHVRLSEFQDQAVLQYQIGYCKENIFLQTGIKTEYFAFPYGNIERDFNSRALEVCEQYYTYIFSSSNWKKYYSIGDRVLNRRHCEPFWNPSHVNYFLSYKKSY